MANVKLNSSGRIPTITTAAGVKILGDLCCPIASLTLVEKKCCECIYQINITGTIAAGCGGSNYYPNRCQPTAYQTESVTIGPFAYSVEVSSESITVDDELLIDGAVFQPNQYLVNLGGGCTARPAATTPQCGGCESFGWTGSTFQSIPSTCNGQHTIPAGTIIAAIPQGNTITLAAGDNHGIQLFVSGFIKIKPTAAP